MPATSMFYRATSPPKIEGIAVMLQAFLMQRAAAVIAALLGGFGVFCIIYSFTAPDVAVQGLILLGAALAMSYFSNRA